jgi:hypothetical protein
MVLTAPLMVYFNYRPIGSVFGDAAALVLWGGFFAVFLWGQSMALKHMLNRNLNLLRWRTGTGAMKRSVSAFFSPSGSLMLLLICLAWWCWQVLNGNYGFLSFVATLFGASVAAWLTFVTGGVWAQLPERDQAATSFAAALVGMGIVVSVVGWVQYLSPGSLAPWINPLTTPGRVYANIRQPNHLALVLAWAIWGGIWWGAQHMRIRSTAVLALVVMVPVLAFTGSRMARLFLIAFVLLSLLSPRRKRMLAFSSGVVALYVATWWGAAWWALEGNGPAFFALDRVGVSDATGGRLDLWRQVVQVLPQIPVGGCGPGQFNFCWTHAALDVRVEGTLNNAHNFVLNSLVEWGWFLTALLMAWVGRAVLSFLQNGQHGVAALPAGMVACALLHAMLEFPQVYPYLLMPTTFALGWMWCASIQPLGVGAFTVEACAPSSGTTKDKSKAWAVLGGVLMVAFGGLYAQQYLALRPFFDPSAQQDTSAQNIRRVVQSTLLFSSIPNYALAMAITESVRVEAAKAMPPYLKLAGRGQVGADFLARFAMVAAIAGDADMSRHLAWRSLQMSPGGQQPMFDMVKISDEAALQDLRRYLLAPYPVNVSIDSFKN